MLCSSKKSSPPWGNVSQQSLCQIRWQRLWSSPVIHGSISLSVCCQKLLTHEDHFDDRNLLKQELYALVLFLHPIKFLTILAGLTPLQECPMDVKSTGKSPRCSWWQRRVCARHTFASQRRFPNVSFNEYVCTFCVNGGVDLFPCSSIPRQLPGASVGVIELGCMSSSYRDDYIHQIQLHRLESLF